MTQKSSFPQTLESVSQALTPDKQSLPTFLRPVSAFIGCGCTIGGLERAVARRVLATHIRSRQ